MCLIVSLMGDGLEFIVLVTDNVNILHGICVSYKYICLGCVVHICMIRPRMLEIAFSIKLS